MCGIIGYIGQNNTTDILLKGLQRLEYRGYDSSGIAVIKDGALSVRKRVGKISSLVKALQEDPVAGGFGIAHTRWATHGRPSEANAHPHVDAHEKIVLVHNGIIENYLELKQRLADRGHEFRTETDSEVIAHMIEDYFSGDLLEAVRKTVGDLKGSYAFVVMSPDCPDQIIGARFGPPLVAGLGDDELFLASDFLALLAYTKRFVFLDDGEIVSLSGDKIRLFDFDGREKEPSVQTIDWDPVQAEKKGYDHFMLKEIYEQPDTIRNTIGGTLASDGETLHFDDLGLTAGDLEQIKKIIIIACGTSWHAALVGKFYFESLSRCPVEVDYGSEFRYRKPIIQPGTLAVFITQSGETADTLAALREAKRLGARVVSICNVMGSMAARESHGVILTHAGPEIGVASTKAFSGQLTALFLLALHLGKIRQVVDSDASAAYLAALSRLPGQVERIFRKVDSLRGIAEKYYAYRNFLYLGRGVSYPIALEGALKLKEISYIHAEGYPSGEMKHGPIALIDENIPIVVLAPQDRLYDKMIANIQEVKARQGRVIAVGTEDDPQLTDMADDVILVPKTLEPLNPVLLVIPLQLLAYYIAVFRECDVDQPRNLAKSVTVE
jgi:glucosamine--fructose-6-phosphate aminotransferase (isomerizing)